MEKINYKKLITECLREQKRDSGFLDRFFAYDSYEELPDDIKDFARRLIKKTLNQGDKG